MKLLFAVKRLASAAGGAERVLCAVCSELARRGHEIAILTFDQPGGRPFYPLDVGVKRIDLGIGDSSRNARLGETLVRMKALRRVARTECPDVAVGFMHSMFVPLAFALAGTGIPVLGSEHTVPEHYRARRLQYFLFRLAAPLLTRLTVLSEAIRLRYPDYVRRRMAVMPNLVEAASGMADVGRERESFTLLCVGRLDAKKDHATLLQAFARITDRFPQWRLKIFGEGPLRPELERLVETLELRTKVTMPGVTSRIGAEYEAAEAFVIPSRYESFGLATAEAMSHGLPVLGFADCPGTNELIENNQTGILAEPGDDRVYSLALALSALFANPALRQRLGNAGRKAIGARFSLQYVCDQWESLLESLIERSS